ncbi:FAR1 DNA binding domain, zinc finger, SWIM-type, MULE transposase domain containing protein [Tanacetum coccineum]
MVFVPFTGINHHNRCITFASGLLADETAGAYIWLLKELKEAFGKDPEVVVTNQDLSMKIAIAECFPDTRHRLCMWHIMMKLGTKVGAVLCNRTDFKRRIYDIVWTDQISLEVFEREWECMINEYELGENKWLGDMFDLRESWIPAYLRDVHMAGLMRTTSRSKSENHFFWYIERKNDHDSRYKTPAFKTDLPMEKEACKLYTRTLFFNVQNEMFASYKYCIALSVVQTENTETYLVDFCKSEVKLHCSYNRCEAYGLLCRHAFYVLRMNNVKEFPKNYLHKRWLKNVKPSSFGRRRITGASDVVQSDVLELYQIFEYTIDRLVHDLDKLHIYKDKMKELLNQACCFSRMKPIAEVTAKELGKRRTCSACGGKEGHNKRTCINGPASKKPKVQAVPKEKAAPKQQASQPRRSELRSKHSLLVDVEHSVDMLEIEGRLMGDKWWRSMGDRWWRSVGDRWW